MSAFAESQLQNGTALLRAGKYDAAIDLFSEVLQTNVAEHGELSPKCGPAYFSYGNALLQKAEQAADVFGDAVADAKQDKNAAGGASSAQQQSEAAECLEIAWEVLDVARVVSSKLDDRDSQLFLAKVLVRLGDLSMETGNFDGGIADYLQGLEIREKLLDASDRLLADVHSSLGVAYRYSASQPECDAAKRTMHRSAALQHYAAAHAVFVQGATVVATRLGLPVTKALKATATTAEQQVDEGEDDEPGDGNDPTPVPAIRLETVSVGAPELDSSRFSPASFAPMSTRLTLSKFDPACLHPAAVLNHDELSLRENLDILSEIANKIEDLQLKPDADAPSASEVSSAAATAGADAAGDTLDQIKAAVAAAVAAAGTAGAASLPSSSAAASSSKQPPSDKASQFSGFGVPTASLAGAAATPNVLQVRKKRKNVSATAGSSVSTAAAGAAGSAGGADSSGILPKRPAATENKPTKRSKLN